MMASLVGVSRERLAWRLVSGVAAMAFAPTVVLAQAVPVEEAAPAQQADEVPIRDIIVTGSRLSNSNFSAPTPVQTLTADDIAQRAPVQIADVVNQLPAFRVTRSATGSGSVADQQGGVQSLLDLRGLDPLRTLVLINGKRTVGTNINATFDSNMIPVGLVERVDVVTGGASAAYGSDAVAGVANFVLRNKMTGLTGSIQTGITEEGDGATYAGSLAGGFAFGDGRGHIVFGVDAAKSSGVGNIYSRSYTSNEPGLLALSAAQRAGTNPAQVFASGVEYANVTPYGLITTRASDGQLYNFDASGSASSFAQGTVYGSGIAAVMTGSTANRGYTPYSAFPLSVANDRQVAYLRGEYEVSDGLTLYAEGNYGRTHQPYSKAAYFTTSLIVPVSSLPTELQPLYTGTNVTVGRILDETGGSQGSQTNEVRRFVLGAKGKVTDWLDYEVAWTHGRFHQSLNTTGLVTSALYKAVYGCNGTTGNPNLNATTVAQAALYESLSGKSCVAINPLGEITDPAALNYIFNKQHQDTWLEQDNVSVNLSGSPFALWAGDVTMAVGGEWRRDSLQTKSTALGENSLFSVGNFTTYGGKNRVWEGYGEIGVPLLRDAPFARTLDFNAAVRRTSYKISGAVTTWKAGGVWEPVDGVRLRATWSRDIRAPSLNELFFVGGGRQTALTNNIAGTAGYGSTGTTIVSGTGNDTLVPEKADTFTGGVVLNPIGNLRISADYYHIKVNGAIARPSTAQTMNICSALLASGAASCPGIVFSSDTATYPNGIVSLQNQQQNLNSLVVSGIDGEISYRFNDLPIPGSLTIRGLLTYAIHNQQELLTGRFENAGSANGVPRWNGSVTLSYENAGSGLDLTMRGFSGVKYDTATLYTLTTGGTSLLLGPDQEGYAESLAGSQPNTISDNTLPGRLYADLSWHVAAGEHFELFGMVSNLLNRKPPANYVAVALSLNSGTRNLNYDILGRAYKIGARFKF
jgi:outer membrane receptor protein involved in Fe transport